MQHLAGVAAIVTKYSSSKIFGTQAESPGAVRLYAAALLRAAAQLDDSIPKPAQVAAILDIPERRVRNARAQCTQMLHNRLVSDFKIPPELKESFISLSWRLDELDSEYLQRQ